MTPDVQRWLAIASVAAAMLYLSMRGWRSWRAARALRRTPGCGPGCGCG